MASNNNSNLMLYVFLFILGGMTIPLLTSCGKSNGIGSSNNNARLIVVNLSPDVQPVKLYARFSQQSTSTYSYPSASTYFLVNVADSPLQIRTALTSNNVIPTNLLTLTKGLTRSVPYTLFIMGLQKDSSLTQIVTVDTTAVPAIGRGKIRLVNAMSNVPSGVNLTLNGATAFTKVPFKGFTDYIEVTSGAYNINVVANNNPTVTLKGLTNFSVLDGKAYTIYSYGLSTGSDTAAYGVNTILNTLPKDTRY